MPNEPHEEGIAIEEEMTIDSLDALKVASDPLRLRLLERLTEPRTVKEVAAELGVVPTSLYYHVGLLARHQLVRIVGTRLVSGILEKRYQVTARRLRVAPALLNIAVTPDHDADSAHLLSTVFANTRAEIEDSLRSGTINPDNLPPEHDALFFVRANGKLPRARAEDFFKRLHALAREFEDTDQEPANPDAPRYAMTLALYPMATDRDHGEAPS